MAWSPGPIVTRRRLGAELKRLRDAAGLKLEVVAARLEMSPSKISRLENGKGIPRRRDVRDMLDVYELADGEERTRLLSWAEQGRQPMWWARYTDVLAPDFATYLELEWDATRIHAYESHIVHGLLQTREYARAILTNAWSTASSSDIDRMVHVRMQRQEALTPDHGLTLHVVLDESTLYREVGSPEIQRRQLEHLIGIAEARHVDLRVLPFSAGIVAAYLSPFSVLDFRPDADRLDRLAHLEQARSSAILDEPADIAEYWGRMQTLLGHSLTEEQSIPLLSHALDRVRVD